IALPPPPLMEGIGTSAMPITTSSPLAQKYFDQGLRLLHCFWDFEAYRAFKEAARLDSACTMAYWGIAAALQQNSSEMNDEKNKALEKAITFSATAGEREQAYIRAAALMRDKGRAAYINEMEALLDHHPNDIEAQLFLARFLSAAPSTYAPDGRPREGKVYGQMILQNLLKTHPDHAAVHHYWIHAVENGPHPERALASAVKLPQLAPRSGHLMHMPGHIYYRIGEYGKAREAFLAALRVDEDYMQAQNIAPVNNWNYTHNLDYLVGNCAEDGRYAEGLKWAAVLQDIDLQQERLKASGLSYIIYGGYTATARLQIRYSFWNEATKSLRQSLDGHELKSSLARGYLNGLLHFAQGMEALEKNKPAVTETHLQALDDLIQRLAGEKVQWGSDWYSGYGKKKLEVSALELRGALLNLQGRQAEAIQLLQEGAQKEKELGYWEPPHYSRPVLESLAQIYLQAKKWEEAREAYRQILRLRPKSGHALLGLARAFWGEGKKDQAAPAYAEFLQTWTQADAPLPQVKEAKTRLANGAR
ncbi:MAG: tetratricopeptide repeat protein, partial [bacterium]